MLDGHLSRVPARVTSIRPAGPRHQVMSLEGGALGYRRRPCTECPWIVENSGLFPLEAFRHSAATSYDAAPTTFACHMSRPQAASICAGFLLAHSLHNAIVRLRTMLGLLDLAQVRDDGRPLFDSYATMAIENGISPDDPVLAPVRSNSGWYRRPGYEAGIARLGSATDL